MLTTAIMILIFLAMLSVLVLVHEFGHLIAAKRSDVKVEEFGIGFPPKLASIKRGGTVYSLNLVPLGGFVKLLGEEDPTEPHSFASKSIGTRALILAAGSLMNLLLPIILFSLVFMIPHNVPIEQIQVQQVAPSSPAAEAGIEQGDIILAINGHKINNYGDLAYYVQLSLGSETTLLLNKAANGEQEVTLVPRWIPPEDEGALGINVTGVEGSQQIIRQSYSPWTATMLGTQRYAETFILFRNTIRSSIIAARIPQVVGPVGIYQMTAEVARTGLLPLIMFTAFISLMLGIINLLPLPALDGGRIVFLLIELARRGKRVSPKVERLVNTVGFALLILLMCIITYFDITRIIGGGSLFE
ncbi:MAG: RIP metalloprotease RseP [Dehalococcoidia bacterium]